MTKEEERYALQQKLDAGKSEKERNILGQYSTPYPLARDMVDYVLSLHNDEDIFFLEPSIGTGVFFSALTEVVKPEMAVGFEVDEHYCVPTRHLWNDCGLNVRQGDFFDFQPCADYNIIMANPPYSRHHHIAGNNKKRLQELVRSEYGLSVSGLSGLYCYFLILSTRWLRPNGLSCWLIPSEFMDVNYGRAVKEFLCSKVELISIHKFNPADLQFSDALVSSSIVTFRNCSPNGKSVKFTSGTNILRPKTIREVPVCDLNPLSKWSLLFDSHDESESVGGRCLGEYFKVSRGISTGNNSFFIVSKKEAEEHNLPSEYLTPVLPAPRHLSVDRIEAGGVGSDDFLLLSCPLPIEAVKSAYPSLYEYIKEGERQALNTSYNCSRRNPWYLCERRCPAPLYMTYMGRGENPVRMFRFILNESRSIVTNSYLMLYPRDNYIHCFADKKTVESVWRILNGIPKERLAKCGRTYGGGLFKIEPKELEALAVPELEGVLSSRQRSLFDF